MTEHDAKSYEASVSRVQRLLEAARYVAKVCDSEAPLVASTGLSPEGVRLALTRYLELDPPDAELRALVEGSAPAPHVHVILSANVFTAPLRALAVACAASEHVTVRPSRRDPFFTRALVRAMRNTGDTSVAIEETREVASVDEGEIHVYGRDETIELVRRAARPGVRIRAHGAGLGVAIVLEGSDPGVAARAIADDVVVFDQRGCLSPRIVVVLGGESRAFAEALHLRLSELDREVPRGLLDDAETREATRYVETLAFAGSVFRGQTHAVGCAPAGTPLTVPPAGRHVHVVAARDLEDARASLHPIARLIVALGCDDAATGSAVLPGDAEVRLSHLGRMQLPPFDGPVDLR